MAAPEPKKKRTPILRWKYTLPTIIILVLLVVFFWFFLDPLLKWGLVSAGEFALEAKVEVASLHTRVRDLSLDIRGLKAANKGAPMTNLFEADRITFAVEPVPLLSKKVIINDMTVGGVHWGTSRTTSGALPPGKLKRIARLKEQAAGQAPEVLTQLAERAKAEANALPAWSSIQGAQDKLKTLSVDKLVNVNELASVKAFNDLKTEYQQKSASYESQLKALDLNAKLNEAAPVFQALSSLQVNTAQDALASAQKVEAARQKVTELQAALDQVNRLKTQAENDFGQVQSLTQRIKEIKDQDLKALSSKLSLPSLSYENLARSLFGPLWISRVNRALELIQTSRQYLAAPKAKQAKPVQPRLRGMDVRFPVANVPPDLLIKRIALSGSTGGAGKTGQPLDFQGQATDVTSDPPLLGRPTRFDLSGTQGHRAYQLTGELDHRQAVPSDTFELTVKGLEAAGLGLPASEYLPSFQAGSVDLATRLSLVGEALDTTLSATVSGLQAPASADGGDAQKLVSELWRGITTLQIAARMQSGPGGLQMSLTSDLDAQLGGRLRSMAGEKLTELQGKLRDEVNRLTSGEESELLKQFDGSKNGTLGQIGAGLKAVQDKINEFQRVIKEKQDAANALVEKQKQETQQKATDQLQNLFKR